MRRLITALCAVGVSGASSVVSAAAFQVFEQDAASLGNYHAGYAASAEDASTAFYNPAGLTRFDHQQLVMAALAVTPNIKYRGTVAVDTLGGKPVPTTTQGGIFGFIPGMSYVAPVSDRIGFGFSVDVPYGMKTSYGESTNLKYVATQTSVTVIDISPSMGLKLTDKASLGAGFDIQKMNAQFDQVGVYGGNIYESDGVNNIDGTGYGYHLGGLYAFNEATRVGVSYHSQVVHHLTGTSSFNGSLEKIFPGSDINSRNKVAMTLPPYTAFSVYHRLYPQWALMGSAIYTQWDIIRNIVLQNAAGINHLEPSTNIMVTIPQYFRSSWNFSVGSNYNATDKVMLRAGLGYDQTPVKNAYRNVQMPDNNRYVVALGGHYQASKTIGMDVSCAHVFINKAHISPPPQVTGDQISTTNGSVRSGADVLGFQVTWDMT